VGPFFGRPPTGEDIEHCGMNLFRVQDGKLVESWLAIETSTLRAARPPSPRPNADAPK
jgi:predicted ester cyclase